MVLHGDLFPQGGKGNMKMANLESILKLINNSSRLNKGNHDRDGV